jgi:uracil-DNA glycosylase
MTANAFAKLQREIRACTICAEHLPLGPRPVFQISRTACILIAGQAPGSKVHASGIPFDDASGNRLRDWLGMDRATFYDAIRVAILPMGFCYSGTGKSGDRPPRPECAVAWREKILRALSAVKLTLVIGQYAMAWHLGSRAKATLTETVHAWREFQPKLWPLPHPSPRNNIWLKKIRGSRATCCRHCASRSNPPSPSPGSP